MEISYNGLWKMLIDKNMYKKDLEAELNISSASMAKKKMCLWMFCKEYANIWNVTLEIL